MPAASITRADIKTTMATIEKPSVAVQTIRHVSAIFAWGVREDLLSVNPCRAVARNVTSDRERVLADSEIAPFWNALDDVDRVHALALRMILLSGQRPGEIRHMRREHIVDNWWTMPLAKAQEKAPFRALVSIDDVGAATAFLALDAARLITGGKALVVGIANEHSIAWGCAKWLRSLGADLAITYLNENAKKFVAPLAEELESEIFMPMNVSEPGQIEAVFERIAKEWGRLDTVVHSIAFSPKEALCSRVVDVSRDGFITTLDVSCWSFMRMAHLAEPLMTKGGTLFTMSHYGSQMVVENYNIMGVAKAALESAVRYMAAELGPKGIRVHAISPGPLATRAASGIPEFDELLAKAQEKAPARALVSIDDVGAATAFLALDAARLITGETLYIDGGYHIID
jgi:enoyl-[acyl-carrier protein] reductase I